MVKMKKLNYLVKSYFDEMGFLILAIVPSTISLYFDIALNTHEWFQRSGSFMVISAIAIDFRQSSRSYVNGRGIFSSMSKGVDGHDGLPLARRIIQRCAIALMVIGTAIWGYGDLIKI